MVDRAQRRIRFRKDTSTMRLLEAVIDANHRALAGDANAGVHPADFADELPIVALVCCCAGVSVYLRRP